MEGGKKEGRKEGRKEEEEGEEEGKRYVFSKGVATVVSSTRSSS